tara:strand:+ start:7086 stop:7526 length:441 start_codon:yes stop_codon:yes gene_type:complete
METINATETMKTITGTKGELVTVINGLFGVQDLKGKKFSLAVSKNIAILKEALQELEDAGKPTDEFMVIAEKVNEIANKNEEGAKEQIETLEKENKELVDARRAQMDNVENLMKEEASVTLYTLEEDLLPDEITAQQINKIIKIIE